MRDFRIFYIKNPLISDGRFINPHPPMISNEEKIQKMKNKKDKIKMNFYFNANSMLLC